MSSYRENKYFYKSKNKQPSTNKRKIKEILKDWTKPPLNYYSGQNLKDFASML
jgi:hypothetical protein